MGKIGARYGEEVFFQAARGGIEPSAKACHRDDGFAHSVDGMDGELIGHESTAIKIVYQLLLAFSIAGEELNGAVAMRADAFTTIDQWQYLWVAENSV